MKIVKLILPGLLFCCCISTAFSQIDPKGSAQSGVNNRANSRIDQGVDKGLDKIEHGVGGLFKKKHKAADSTKAATIVPAKIQDLKYLVVINYKSADATDKANAEKLVPVIIANAADKPVSYYLNDLSTTNSAAASAAVIKLMGLQALQKSFNKVDVAGIVDIQSLKIIKVFKLYLSAKEIEKNLTDALSKAE